MFDKNANKKASRESPTSAPLKILIRYLGLKLVGGGGQQNFTWGYPRVSIPLFFLPFTLAVVAFSKFCRLSQSLSISVWPLAISLSLCLSLILSRSLTLSSVILFLVFVNRNNFFELLSG